MFRVVAFCDNKKLGDVFEALAGKVIGQPEAVAVVGAEVKNGKVAAASNGELVSLFMQWAGKHKLTSVNASDARKFLSSIGKAESASNYLLKRCQEYAVLRKVGAGMKTSYNLVTPKRPRGKKGK
jgi:hypothetical protein